MKIILISGKAQHGKDTTAKFLQDALQEKGQRVLIAHYGDLDYWARFLADILTMFSDGWA